MRSHIRLAERQGILQGKHLSPVQTKCLIILNFLDDIQRHHDDITALKRSLLSSGLAEPAKLFPQEFNPEVKELSEVEDDSTVNFDYSDVTWKSGGDAFAEYEKLMSQVRAAQSGRMSGAELVERPEWTDWS
jgi:hypothetical protein